MFEHLLQISLDDLSSLVHTFGPALLEALLLLLIGGWLAARLANFLQRAMGRASFDPTLSGFLRNLVYGVLIAVLIVMALQTAGVPSAPLLAALGAGGLAIGLALQGSLSNLAWGVLLIVFRPFKVGDFIHAGGVDGTVEGINLMHTQLVLADNREAVVPNAKIGADAIINFSRRGTRRFELRVGIGYGDDIGKAIAVVQRLFQADPRILQDPAPTVWTDSLGDSSVNLLLRGHTANADFWPAQTDLLRAVKEQFDAENISIPFPQRDVRIVNAPAAGG
ncbi:mechanosensitive ion channel family protein [Dyella mobilis]|uniref:Small-conductance mechanosensitive channel n=1 Tax=Dyella mobilis TaxID=1849582 RepID=A0ABS2KNN3_9GAMM|nr:mechanosensitive ion channel domain-containing protein [Dyella mobilis]MBM7132417.1 mechanosensitive ion channel [Dyella mobilis]GLQ95595.1 mechanosensitive ion channel protein [Dyella mobilis]